METSSAIRHKPRLSEESIIINIKPAKANKCVHIFMYNYFNRDWLVINEFYV
uniref:Uncharacterized protein n=1 Tax=Heterorhabditis bacteriophora TaxID=37862 RepID=A0A1I7XDW4_HETBA